MAEITGDKEVANLLRRLRSKYGSKSKVDVIVGYTAEYAIYVHEDMFAHHPVGKAKYLEDPLRANRKMLLNIVKQALVKGVPLDQALLMAGYQLQRLSQLEVPIDTGNLKGSAFTRIVAL